MANPSPTKVNIMNIKHIEAEIKDYADAAGKDIVEVYDEVKNWLHIKKAAAAGKAVPEGQQAANRVAADPNASTGLAAATAALTENGAPAKA